MQNTASHRATQVYSDNFQLRTPPCGCTRPEKSKPLDKSKQLTKICSESKNALSDLSPQQLSDRKHWHSKQENKTISDHIAYSLLSVTDESDPMRKAYLRTLSCSKEVIIENGTPTTIYCGNRWCMTCNRIRTAVNIDGYYKPVKAMKNPQFVTLTFRSIPTDQLSDKIEDPFKAWRKIMQAANYRYKKTNQVKYKLSGVRKVEANYNPHQDWFNVHFHVIIDGESSANWLVDRWMQTMRKMGHKVDRSAQDIEKVAQAGKALKELFKYVTKVFTGVSKSRSKRSTKEDFKRLSFYPDAMHQFFTAMRGKRSIQPFGGIRKVEDDPDKIELRSETASFLPDGHHVYNYCPDRMAWIARGEPMLLDPMTYETKNLIKKIPFDRSKIPIYQEIAFNHDYNPKSALSRHLVLHAKDQPIASIKHKDLVQYFENFFTKN